MTVDTKELVTVYELNSLGEYKYVVVLSEYNGKIVLSRHKERTTIRSNSE